MPRKPAEKHAKSKRRARKPSRAGEDLTGEARLIAEEELPLPPEIGSDQASPEVDNPRPAASEPGAPEMDQNTGSLVPFDPLSRYLAEIRRFPLLSREEEVEVAKRYLETHDPQAALTLVTA
ncbi:MAG TPA: sigma-70 factor domain-containing protein, partial [Candidatus Binataceae bacterium]